VRMWFWLGILLALGLLSVIGYFVMIDVKPNAPRPEISQESRAEIATLERRLMQHVRVLGATIGERNLYRPRALRAAADYIRQVWTEQGHAVRQEDFEVAGQPCANLVVEQEAPARRRRSCWWALITTRCSEAPAPTTMPPALRCSWKCREPETGGLIQDRPVRGLRQ
jgi:hypothetical protein